MAPPDPVLLIGGCPRSGTTLLRNMFAAHPRLAAPPESFWIASTWHRLASAGASSDLTAAWETIRKDRFFREWGVPEADVVALRHRFPPATFADLVRLCFGAHAALQGAQLSVDKTPNHLLDYPVLKPLLPSSKWAFVVRDPRATVMSWVCQTFTRGGVASGAIEWRRHYQAAKRVSGLEPTMTTVRYEDLLADPPRALGQLCDLAGVPFDAVMVESYGDHVPRGVHHRASGQPLRPTMRSWRDELTKVDVAVIEGICGEAMDDLGYERVCGRRSVRAAAATARAWLGEIDRGWLTRRYGWYEPLEPTSASD